MRATPTKGLRSKDSVRDPFVTVIVPVRNEVRYIQGTLGAILAQRYPSERMQIIVVDGMSDDGTREVIQDIAGRVSRKNDVLPPYLNVLDNPAQITSTALNIGLARARGDVVIRVDGHCRIARDYVRRCVATLASTGADCVGGSMVTVGQKWVARAISLAQSTFFGVGGAAFRTGKSTAGFVDTVAFGAYRRGVFEQIGGFDEELVRNQDDEFNFRLIQSGGRIWLNPAIQSVYYSRLSFRGLWDQYFSYGLYKVRVIQKRHAVPSWRLLVPPAFVLALLASLTAGIAPAGRLPLATLAAGYSVATALASFWTARQDWRALPLLPAAFATMHFAYGLGFLVGCWRWRGHFGERPSLMSPIKLWTDA
jgi:succinoglycan biosynthesis protein ExoA